jgi:hypothetical protein
MKAVSAVGEERRGFDVPDGINAQLEKEFSRNMHNANVIEVMSTKHDTAVIGLKR